MVFFSHLVEFGGFKVEFASDTFDPERLAECTVLSMVPATTHPDIRVDQRGNLVPLGGDGSILVQREHRDSVFSYETLFKMFGGTCPGTIASAIRYMKQYSGVPVFAAQVVAKGAPYTEESKRVWLSLEAFAVVIDKPTTARKRSLEPDSEPDDLAVVDPGSLREEAEPAEPKRRREEEQGYRTTTADILIPASLRGSVPGWKELFGTMAADLGDRDQIKTGLVTLVDQIRQFFDNHPVNERMEKHNFFSESEVAEIMGMSFSDAVTHLALYYRSESEMCRKCLTRLYGIQTAFPIFGSLHKRGQQFTATRIDEYHFKVTEIVPVSAGTSNRYDHIV